MASLFILQCKRTALDVQEIPADHYSYINNIKVHIIEARLAELRAVMVIKVKIKMVK